MNRMGEQNMMCQKGLAWAVFVGVDKQGVLLFTGRAARGLHSINSNMVTTRCSREAEAETQTQTQLV